MVKGTCANGNVRSLRWMGAVVLPTMIIIGCATNEPVIVSSAEYGALWPFHAGEATLYCGDTGAIWAEIDGQHYALNALAPAWVEERHPDVVLSDLAPIWRDDPNLPGTKADLGPVMDRALAICGG